MKHNIVFLDEASIPNVDLTALRALGNYRAFDDTLADKIIENSQGAEIIITKSLFKNNIYNHFNIREIKAR